MTSTWVNTLVGIQYLMKSSLQEQLAEVFRDESGRLWWVSPFGHEVEISRILLPSLSKFQDRLVEFFKIPT